MADYFCTVAQACKCDYPEFSWMQETLCHQLLYKKSDIAFSMVVALPNDLINCKKATLQDRPMKRSRIALASSGLFTF